MGLWRWLLAYLRGDAEREVQARRHQETMAALNALEQQKAAAARADVVWRRVGDPPLTMRKEAADG